MNPETDPGQPQNKLWDITQNSSSTIGLQVYHVYTLEISRQKAFISRSRGCLFLGIRGQTRHKKKGGRPDHPTRRLTHYTPHLLRRTINFFRLLPSPSPTRAAPLFCCQQVDTVADRWANFRVPKSDQNLESLKTDSKSRYSKLEVLPVCMHSLPHRISRKLTDMVADSK